VGVFYCKKIEGVKAMQEKIENELAAEIFKASKLKIISNPVFEKFLSFWDNVIAERADAEHNAEMKKLKGVKENEV
jgi:hypothetical protein